MTMEGNDMIVGLYRLPDCAPPGNIKIKRAFVGDKQKILSFVENQFGKGWLGETEHALMQEVPKCFIATENGRIVGFACYDATARGYFGPIGVDASCRGKSVGAALLIATLNAMREYGYGYAVIGWVNEAAGFYRKTVGAVNIPDGTPENTVYSNMVIM